MTGFVEGNYQDKYNTRNPISRWLMARFLNSFETLLMNAAQSQNVTSICEIGCGEGELLKVLRHHFPQVALYACDLSPNEIQKAEENCRGLDIQFSVQDATQLQYDTDQFDLIIACEVLEHLPDPQKGLAEIQRIGSRGIVSVPVEPLWRILNMARLTYLNAWGNTPGHLNHWSRRSFQRFLSDSTVTITTTKSPYPWQMYQILLQEPPHL